MPYRRAATSAFVGFTGYSSSSLSLAENESLSSSSKESSSSSDPDISEVEADDDEEPEDPEARSRRASCDFALGGTLGLIILMIGNQECRQGCQFRIQVVRYEAR